MPQWMSSLGRFLLDHKEILATASTTIGLMSLLFKWWPKILVRWQEQQRKYRLQERVNALDYTEEDVARATSYYIEPECQVVDPSGAEDFRRIYPVRQNLFEVVDDLLYKQTPHKFSLILGDTGMGKTSFLLNYYARHWHSASRRRRFPIALIPLGGGASNERIAGLDDKANTVLFLDAFDEDTLAARDTKARFHQLIGACSRFQHVLMTCRTQFFSKDDEIPKEAGIIRVGPIGPGDSREYSINKLYLSPFSDEQIREYIQRRFPFWQARKRHSAFELIKKIEDLPARPMLLAQIELILSLGEECKYSFQIYEQMIRSWLNREKGMADPICLREFCEWLAVDMFVHRDTRGAEKISIDELVPLSAKFGVDPPKIEHIRGRSLLNRDAQGNLKFAHRSIMEYLFVARFRKFPKDVPKVEWTDQMKRFYWETSFDAWERSKTTIAFQNEADFSGLERLRLKPIIRLRDHAETFTVEDAAQFRNMAQEKHSRVERAPHFYRSVDVPAASKEDLSTVAAGYKSLVGSQLPDGPVLNSALTKLLSFLSSGKGKVVADHALGVAWEVPGDTEPAHPALVDARATVLSYLRFGDLRGWRIPTMDEAFSLVHLAHCGEYKLLFEGLEQRIWVTDRLGIQRLSVNLQTADIRAEGFSQPTRQWPRAVCIASAWSGGPSVSSEE